MILVVDKRNRARSIALRERFLAAGIPCALCTPDVPVMLRGAAVAVVFAPDEGTLGRAVSGLAHSAVIAVNVSKKRLFFPGALIPDGASEDATVASALRLLFEKTGATLREITAGAVRVTDSRAYIKMKLLALTKTERLILCHLAASPDTFHTAARIAKFALRSADLRRARTSVAAHVCAINKKALRAAGVRIIACRRGLGYAIIPDPETDAAPVDRPGFSPTFG